MQPINLSKLKGGQPARCFCRCYISLGASSLCLLGHSQFRDRSSSPQSSSVALVVLVLMDRDRTSGSERSEVLPFHFWWNRLECAFPQAAPRVKTNGATGWRKKRIWMILRGRHHCSDGLFWRMDIGLRTQEAFHFGEHELT